MGDAGWRHSSNSKSVAGKLCLLTKPASFCEQWLAHEALLVVPGMIIDRDQFLAAVRSEQPWRTHEINDAGTVAFGEDCAAVLYRVTARRGDQAPCVALITGVYARRDGSWKLIYHQQTPSPA